MKLMDMPALELVNLEMDAPAVLAQFHPDDRWRRVIHFRATVTGLVNVRIGADRVGIGPAGCFRIDRLREGQFKAVTECMNREDFKREPAGPVEPLE